jgi:hypothetical protein
MWWKLLAAGLKEDKQQELGEEQTHQKIAVVGMLAVAS